MDIGIEACGAAGRGWGVSGCILSLQAPGSLLRTWVTRREAQGPSVRSTPKGWKVAALACSPEWNYCF